MRRYDQSNDQCSETITWNIPMGNSMALFLKNIPRLAVADLPTYRLQNSLYLCQRV